MCLGFAEKKGKSRTTNPIHTSMIHPTESFVESRKLIFYGNREWLAEFNPTRIFFC